MSDPETLESALDVIERLTAELAQANEKQDRWYEAEAKIRGAIDELGGNELFRKAIELAGANTDNPIVAERDRLQQECARIASENACRMISERRLRAALERIAVDDYSRSSCCGRARIAREALAGGGK